MIEPINVPRKEFPMSTAKSEGMIPLYVKLDNYELQYEYDVEYISRGEMKLYLQIIIPVDAGIKLPLVVYIPGSAFHKQDVKARVAQLGYLANRGFAIALLEYRGSEIAPFPAQTLDAKAGVQYMKQQAEKYNIDPDKVVIMGDSSGGHTALMAGFSQGIAELEEEEEKNYSSSVKGVIDLYGPTNIATMNEEPSSMDHRTPDSPEGFLIGQRPVLLHPELVKPTVISTYVSKGRAIPPVLMFHGTNDELVPFGQGCELYDALQQAKKDVTFYQVIGANHGGREFWSNETLDIMEKFIRRVVS